MKERKKIDIANQSGERQVSVGVVEDISKSKPPLSVKYLSLNCQIFTSFSKRTDHKLRLAAWRRSWWNCGSLSVSSTTTSSHLLKL